MTGLVDPTEPTILSRPSTPRVGVLALACSKLSLAVGVEVQNRDRLRFVVCQSVSFDTPGYGTTVAFEEKRYYGPTFDAASTAWEHAAKEEVRLSVAVEIGPENPSGAETAHFGKPHLPGQPLIVGTLDTKRATILGICASESQIGELTRVEVRFEVDDLVDVADWERLLAYC